VSAIHKLEQAQQRLQQGDIAGAQLLCEQVLRRSPRDPEALYLLGIGCLISSRAGDAVPFLERAVSASPQHGAALENLGLAHLLLGRFAEAERVLRKAVALPGAPASVHMRLGLAVLHQQRYPEAIEALQRALELEPRNLDCHLNLGQAFARLGDGATARNHFETVLRLSPGHVDAMFNIGVLALERDELDQARQWFERARAQSPRHVDVLVNLGIVLQKQRRLEEAAGCFRRALEIDPALAAAGNNLAHTLMLQRRLKEAREQYLATLSVAPGMIVAHEGLAAACIRLGRLKEGILHLREVLRLDRDSCDIRTALADALFQDGQLDEAESAAQRGNELDSDAVGPYSVLAQIHTVRGEFERAAAVLEAGFQRTGADSLLGTLTHQLRRICDWKKWRETWPQLASRLDRSAELGSPFWLLAESTTAQQQLSYTRRWAQKQFGDSGDGREVRRAFSIGSRRLRVGYFSCDFQEHAVAYLVAEVLELHDRQHFEIFAYSYGPGDPSPMRARLRQACEHFVDVARDPDDIAVDRIRRDELDVLVDLHGYTVGARTAILARRPCPVQINWLGYPGTMGAAFMDYLIADSYIIPAGQESAYAERILRLPHCYQPNDRKRPLAEPLSRAEYRLPDQGFVFCCFNQAVKITQEIFACWMRLLRRVPHSVLWLLEDNPRATRNLSDAARGHGIAPERLMFAPRLPHAQHLARYRVVDLALDTFPYTSHTTASDALWQECPLVALCGDTFASRVSGSILTACGLPELITHSLPEFEDIAYRLASDADFMRHMRARLSSAKTSAPLFDSTAFTRNLEHLYTNLAAQSRQQ
jgi:predicted O-linked N-acetylglucosamine transferase (SPINDLY family)